MKLIGRTEITTIEEPDHLQFVIVRENGLVDLVFAPVLLTVFAVYAWKTHNWWLLLFCGVGFVYILANYLNGPETRLSATDEKLAAIGNLGRAFTNEVRIKAEMIETLGYYGGGEDGTPGLYVNQSDLIVKLDEKQANAIANTIRERFPLLERGDQSPTSLLHGEDSGITTLGLSGVPHRNSEP